MTGVRRKASNSFSRRHHHNSCYSSGASGCEDICTTTPVISLHPTPTLWNQHIHAYTMKNTHACYISSAKCLRAESEGHRRWLLYACCLCVGFCEWDPRVGRSLIPQGAHCSAGLGVSLWLRGWAGDKLKIWNQADLNWHPTPLWRGWARWPLVLSGTLRCVHCVIDSISISRM